MTTATAIDRPAEELHDLKLRLGEADSDETEALFVSPGTKVTKHPQRRTLHVQPSGEPVARTMAMQPPPAKSAAPRQLPPPPPPPSPPPQHASPSPFSGRDTNPMPATRLFAPSQPATPRAPLPAGSQHLWPKHHSPFADAFRRLSSEGAPARSPQWRSQGLSSTALLPPCALLPPNHPDAMRGSPVPLGGGDGQRGGVVELEAEECELGIGLDGARVFPDL
jgi:hypothetical protein